MKFKLKAPFKPKGSQPEAIKELVEEFKKSKIQTLLGVTGSGKTFTMANIIEKLQRPTIIIAHNKTLAGQLYNEFKEFFPENRVEYFVSYYDYYQPESYLPNKDMYIEKDAQINPKIELMRLSATTSLLTRPDTIVIASVSCIYSVGKPENYENMGIELRVGNKIKRKELIKKLVEIQFQRNDIELTPGRFRVKGETIDIVPGFFNQIIRVEMFGDTIEKVKILDKVTGEVKEDPGFFFIFPAKHFIATSEEREKAIKSIKEELDITLPNMDLIESHRLKKRTMYDLEMIKETEKVV